MNEKTLSSHDFRGWLCVMGLSHEEAAALLGVSLSTIQSYTCGRSLPPHHAKHCRLFVLLKLLRLEEKLSDIPRKAGGFYAEELKPSAVCLLA